MRDIRSVLNVALGGGFELCHHVDGLDDTLMSQKTWRSRKAVHLNAWYSSPIASVEQKRHLWSDLGMPLCRPSSISNL